MFVGVVSTAFAACLAKVDSGTNGSTINTGSPTDGGLSDAPPTDATAMCSGAVPSATITIPQCEGTRIRQASASGLAVDVHVRPPPCKQLLDATPAPAVVGAITVTPKGLPSGVTSQSWSMNVSCTNDKSGGEFDAPVSLYFDVAASASVNAATTIAIDIVDFTGATATVSPTLEILPSGSGSLDPSFGDGGFVNGMPDDAVDDNGSLANIPCPRSPVALQGDGKILAGGHFVGAPAGSCLARFDANGAIDTTFASNGFAATIVPSAIAVSPSDQKVLVCSGDSLVRLGPNGAVDLTFGTNGSVAIANPPCQELAIDSAHNRIFILRHFANRSGRRLDAYTLATGTIDTTFGGSGTVDGIGLEDPDGAFAHDGVFVQAIAQPDGKLVVFDGRIGRLNGDGTIDPAFGPVAREAGEVFTGVALQGTNIVAADVTLRTPSVDSSALIVRRLKVDGTNDSTFGVSNGSTALAVPFFRAYPQNSRPPVVMNDNRLIVLGSIGRGGVFNLGGGLVLGSVLARFTAEGALDTTFGVDGWSAVGRSPNGIDVPIQHIVVQPDGKIIAIGGHEPTGVLPSTQGSRSALLRLMP